MRNRDLKSVYGYIYLNKEGKEDNYIKVELVNSKENIASFIFNCPSKKKYLVTNIFDEPLFNTYGSFLNNDYDLDYRNFFIDELMALLRYEKEPINLEIIHNEEYGTLEEFKKFIYENTGYKL